MESHPQLKYFIWFQYPAWLSENKDQVDSKDFERYVKQNKYMQAICAEFETEAPMDSDDVKKARFDKILELMQHMQELGYPPKDITGDIVSFFIMCSEKTEHSNLTVHVLCKGCSKYYLGGGRGGRQQFFILGEGAV